ncbi:low density lipoprotein receptor adapter 1-like [Solea senegalensis]|uniref:Low density lipoprotein receptor adapter 1-like n=1 Tax=Solea senegalensis TaxID=28829 RepID=A0AAV6QX96_SOLSE|nr:low density lipoprotein receptor adapter 1-like [Solea senegalensis]
MLVHVCDELAPTLVLNPSPTGVTLIHSRVRRSEHEFQQLHIHSATETVSRGRSAFIRGYFSVTPGQRREFSSVCERRSCLPLTCPVCLKRSPELHEDGIFMKVCPDKDSECSYTPFRRKAYHWEKLCLKRTGSTIGVHASAKISTKTSVKRTMSLSTFQLVQTLKNSPAAFRRRFRRDRTESLSHGDPLFKVHYLGTEKIFSLDREQAQDAISHMLDGIANGKKLSKDHALVVRPRYVEVKELSTGRQLTKTYLQDIAYCAADPNRPNVFLYICKHHGKQLQCRVFWCSRAERARDMKACLAHSFQRALNDWQQDDSATLPPGEAKGKRVEESSNSPINTKSSTLPASLGKAGRREAPCLTAP